MESLSVQGDRPHPGTAIQAATECPHLRDSFKWGLCPRDRKLGEDLPTSLAGDKPWPTGRGVGRRQTSGMTAVW